MDDQIWKLEGVLLDTNIKEQVAALKTLSDLWISDDQDRTNRILALLIKFTVFSQTHQAFIRICIVQLMQQNKTQLMNIETDWKHIVDVFRQDLFSNFYRFRIASLKGIQSIIQKLEGQFDIYHQVFEIFIAAQEESEIQVAYDTLRLLGEAFFEVSFLKKVEKLEFSKLTCYRFRKINLICVLLNHNRIKVLDQYQKSYLVTLGNLLTFLNDKNIRSQKSKDYLIMVLHFFQSVAKSQMQKQAITVLDDIILNSQIETGLLEQSQSFVQSFLLIFLKTLRSFSNKQALNQNQKERLLSFIHNLRDSIRGITNLHKMTALQRIIAKINHEFNIQIQVKQNIFNLETKQYSQQSILIDEYFQKLIRLFETNQVYQLDFLIKSHRQTLIDIGYQNIDQYLTTSVSNIRKQTPNTLFTQSQFLIFLSHLLNLLVSERLTTVGKFRKIQEQILSLNKILSKYVLECFRILYENNHYLKYDFKEVRNFVNQLFYLMGEVNGGFYIVENRDLAQKDVITERVANQVLNVPQKYPVHFWIAAVKMSLHYGDLDLCQRYIQQARIANNLPYTETYIDYLEQCRTFLIDNETIEDFEELNDFQLTKTQALHRKNIIRNYRSFYQVVKAFQLRDVNIYNQLQELEWTLTQHQKMIELLYGWDYAEDAYTHILYFIKKLIIQMEKSLEIPSNDDKSWEEYKFFIHFTWIGQRLSLLNQDSLIQTIQLSRRIPKVLLQIRQSPYLKVTIRYSRTQEALELQQCCLFKNSKIDSKLKLKISYALEQDMEQEFTYKIDSIEDQFEGIKIQQIEVTFKQYHSHRASVPKMFKFCVFTQWGVITEEVINF